MMCVWLGESWGAGCSVGCWVVGLCGRVVRGDMQGFINMNVFYTEDELRKQAGTFTGNVRM